MKTTALLLLSAIGTLAQESVSFVVYSDPDCSIPLREGADPNEASQSLTVETCHVLSYTSPLDGHLQTNSYSNFHCEDNAVTWTHTPGNADCTGSKVIIDKLYTDQCTPVATHMGLTYQKLINYDTPCSATYEYPEDTVYSGDEYSDMAVADLSGTTTTDGSADTASGVGGGGGGGGGDKASGFRVSDSSSEGNPFGNSDFADGSGGGNMKGNMKGKDKGNNFGKSMRMNERSVEGKSKGQDKGKGKDKKGSGSNPFGGARINADEPTDAPTDASTDAPTDASTDAPTDAPTDASTDAPTDAPTDGPVNIALPTRPAAPARAAAAAGSTRLPPGVPPAGTRLDSSFLLNRNRPAVASSASWAAPATSAYGFGSAFGSYLPYGNVARTYGTSYTAPATTAATTATTAATAATTAARATVANTGFGFGGYGNYGNYGNYGGFGGYGNYGGFGGYGNYGSVGTGFGGYWGR